MQLPLYKSIPDWHCVQEGEEPAEHVTQELEQGLQEFDWVICDVPKHCVQFVLVPEHC